MPRRVIASESNFYVFYENHVTVRLVSYVQLLQAVTDNAQYPNQFLLKYMMNLTAFRAFAVIHFS